MESPTLETPHNRRVLIVDDQNDVHDDFEELLGGRSSGLSAELASAFLDEGDDDLRVDFELHHVMNGETAVEAVSRACGAGKPFAVAFVDIRMPSGMDGVETVRSIRRVDPDVEIVIMTAYTDKRLSDIVRGVDPMHKLLYIRKPFVREEIQQIALALIVKWNVEQNLAAGRQQLAASHDRLEAVLDATGDAIAMFDETGQLVFANRWFEDLHDVVGDPWDVGMASRDRFRSSFRTVGDKPYGSERSSDEGELVEHTTAAGLRRLFVRTEKAMHDAQGGRDGDLVVLRDVSKEIEIQRMRDEVLRLRAELDGRHGHGDLIGTSPRIVQMRTLMRRAAEGGLPVLVEGESGTGKELVARSLHFNGPRSAGPFVPVNCAGLPPTLTEAELFGYERGAFTGAYKRHVGAFERAHGGTIFLDEVGDMEPALQGRLLRVLQTRQIERLGGTGVIDVDCEVVSATNKDLDAAMRSGEFREDLYYRIAAFPIRVPPLRDRPDDIPTLAAHFLDIAAERAGKRFQGFSQDALVALVQHDWPGNVRELEHAVGRAVLLETSDWVRPGSLGIGGRRGGVTDLVDTGEVVPLAEVERRTVLRTLELFDNNISRTARALGVSRSTLHRKLAVFRPKKADPADTDPGPAGT